VIELRGCFTVAVTAQATLRSEGAAAIPTSAVPGDDLVRRLAVAADAGPAGGSLARNACRSSPPRDRRGTLLPVDGPVAQVERRVIGHGDRVPSGRLSRGRVRGPRFAVVARSDKPFAQDFRQRACIGCHSEATDQVVSRHALVGIAAAPWIRRVA